jgi:hypothetical protein
MIDERHASGEFNFLPRTVMSRVTFEGLRLVEGTPTFCAAQSEPCKALIERDGRTFWHVVETEIHHGITFYFASEIVVRAYRAE